MEKRRDVTITIENATDVEALNRIGRVARSLSETAADRDGGIGWQWEATLRDEDETSGYGCAPTDLPGWLFDEGSRREATVAGQRVVFTDHLALAVRGTARRKERGPAGQSVSEVIRAATEAGLAHLFSPIAMGEPNALVSAAYLPEDETGSAAWHFRVDIGRAPRAFALRYVALLERLYPGCSWHIHSMSEVAQAWDVEGRVVAVVMPTSDPSRSVAK